MKPCTYLCRININNHNLIIKIMYFYFYDWNDNYQPFDTLKDATTAAIKEGINKIRDTNGGEYFL